MKDINKILVHLPDDPFEVLETVPFLSTLKRTYPKSQITVLMNEEHQKLLEPFPLDLEIYHLPEEIYKNPMSIHKYAYNLHPVFNIDLSFSLRHDWKSAFLAFCFRSRNRLGAYSIQARPFLTQFEKKLKKLPANELGFKLLKMFLKDQVGEKRVPLPDYQVDDEFFGEVPIVPIILFHEDYLNENLIQQLREYLDLTGIMKFKFYKINNSEDLELPNKIDDLNPNNHYEFFLEKPLDDYRDLCQKIFYANGVITSDPLVTFYCDFFEVPFYYIGHPHKKLASKKQGVDLSRDDKDIFNVAQMADSTDEHFKIK